jgi:hypothetical protein
MATWTPQTKNTTSYSNQTRGTNTFTTQGKSTSNGFILLQTGFYALLQSGGKIILTQSYDPSYTNLTKH